MLNIQLSLWVPGLFTLCGCICLCHRNTRCIYWRKWRLEMFSVVSEFSFVRSPNSALYHEHYIGNSEWVNRERFRTRLLTLRLRQCVFFCYFFWFIFSHVAPPPEELWDPPRGGAPHSLKTTGLVSMKQKEGNLYRHVWRCASLSIRGCPA